MIISPILFSPDTNNAYALLSVARNGNKCALISAKGSIAFMSVHFERQFALGVNMSTLLHLTLTYYNLKLKNKTPDY